MALDILNVTRSICIGSILFLLAASPVVCQHHQHQRRQHQQESKNGKETGNPSTSSYEQPQPCIDHHLRRRASGRGGLDPPPNIEARDIDPRPVCSTTRNPESSRSTVDRNNDDDMADNQHQNFHRKGPKPESIGIILVAACFILISAGVSCYRFQKRTCTDHEFDLLRRHNRYDDDYHNDATNNDDDDDDDILLVYSDNRIDVPNADHPPGRSILKPRQQIHHQKLRIHNADESSLSPAHDTHSDAELISIKNVRFDVLNLEKTYVFEDTLC